MDHHSWIFDDPMDTGAAYALYRHGQDQQTIALIKALGCMPAPAQVQTNVQIVLDEDRDDVPVVNARPFATGALQSWDDYIGQEALKRQLRVYIDDAKQRGTRLPHTLLASGMPGVGKTAMARLLASEMGTEMVELVPPFNIHTLVRAMEGLCDSDIVFIDEVHLLQNLRRGGEILLKVLEDGVAFMPDGETVELNDITIVAGTTDKDVLPEPVLDRFKVQPYFQPYSPSELQRICMSFGYRHGCHQILEDHDDALIKTVAAACRGAPRVVDSMVISARALASSLGRTPTPKELLEFLEVEPDGMTRVHIHYITAMRAFFSRRTKDQGIEYVAGEMAMLNLLRETRQGLGRIERFLIERGLLDRTPRGRRLTPRGIKLAEHFIRQGKGAGHV